MRFEDYTWPCEYEAPLKSQVQTTLFLLNNKRGFVLNEMGTGKTLSALWATDILFINRKISKVLISTVLSTVHSVWVQHLFKNFPQSTYAVLTGTKKEKLRQLDRDVQYYIINHDGLKNIEKELRAKGFDVLIIDELTAFKTFNNDRSKCGKRIADKFTAVWGMTGNPTPNTPDEAFGQAKIVNPDNVHLPTYYTKFKHMVMKEVNEYTWVPREGHEHEVARILSPAIRFTRDECVDLPPCTVPPITEVAMHKEQSKVYKDLQDEYISSLATGDITAGNAAAKAVKLLQVSSGVVYDDSRNHVRLPCGPKLKALWDLWLNVNNKKLIIFCAFTGSIHMLQDFFTKKKVSHRTIDGSIKPADRATYIDQFQTADLEILILQPAAASHGITLTAANTACWFTPVTSGEIYQQANARITRPGQKHKQLIARLSCSPVEAAAYQALQRKEKLGAVILKLFE